ncbi:hypothetical protein P3S67_030635 [Capsicum chacoense]
MEKGPVKYWYLLGELMRERGLEFLVIPNSTLIKKKNSPPFSLSNLSTSSHFFSSLFPFFFVALLLLQVKYSDIR